MNDNPSYTAIGDEPVEARIVAWVLGEASAFEAEELQRLCEELPELLVFRRRMLALHGLLQAAAATDQPDAAWHLPPAKRHALDAILGEPPPASVDSLKEHRIRRAGWRAIYAMAACLVMAVVVWQLVRPLFVRQTIHAPQTCVDFMLGNVDREQAKDMDGDNFKASASNASQATSEPRSSPFNDDLPGNGIVDTKGIVSMPPAGREESLRSDLNGRTSYRRVQKKPAAQDAMDQLAKHSADLLESTPAGPGATSAPESGTKRGKALLSPKLAPKTEMAVRTPPPVTAPATWGLADSADRKDAGMAAGAGSSLARARTLTLKHAANQPAAPPPAEPDNSKLKRIAGVGIGSGRVAKQDVSMAMGEIVANTDVAGDLATNKEVENDSSTVPLGRLAARDESDRDERAKLRDANGYTGTTSVTAGSLGIDGVNAYSADSLLTTEAAGKPAKPMVPDLTTELAATADPYSTFSLNISDASFQVAQAALAKGERPDPAAIKVEQFYNAVDYGDPAPTAGEPVALAIEQAAHPLVPGRNLVRVALKTAAAGRAASQALRLTLLVDQSGSMVRDDRRAAMAKALAGLASLLTPNDRVTVVGFARTPRLLADGWTGPQAAQLVDLVNQSASEGGTNLEEAIKLGTQLATQRQVAGAQNRIVLFTDGAANLGDADPASLARKVQALRQQGLAFDIAGIAADGLNDELLGELARNGNGRYYVVGKGVDDDFARQLAGAFRPAAENVKVQVHFNPERVGRYKLLGFEQDRLTTEDFHNDAVDAAELAAEEAGVAIYQVEPLPGGSGELGEVSVRFRDVASGQMVERTWTIPYAAGAPAFDRASPSIQLAGLAMLAAEKLRGGPLAAAIDFKKFAASRATVKRHYGNSARVAAVLEMINSL